MHLLGAIFMSKLIHILRSGEYLGQCMQDKVRINFSVCVHGNEGTCQCATIVFQ